MTKYKTIKTLIHDIVGHELMVNNMDVEEWLDDMKPTAYDIYAFMSNTAAKKFMGAIKWQLSSLESITIGDTPNNMVVNVKEDVDLVNMYLYVYVLSSKMDKPEIVVRNIQDLLLAHLKENETASDIRLS